MQVIKLDILKGCIGDNRHASDDVVLSAASHLFQVSNGQFVHCFVGFGLGSIIKDVLGSFLSFYFNRNKTNIRKRGIIRHLQVQARQGRWKEKRDRVFTAQSFRSAGFRLGTLFFFMICERELFVVTGEGRYCWGFETFGNSSKAELSTRNEGEIFSTRNEGEIFFYNRKDPF